MTGINGNRAATAESPGPKTDEGKLRSSLNAMRHGFASNSMRALAFEFPEMAEAAMKMAVESVAPAGPAETLVCARLAMAFCKLRRLELLESQYVGLGNPGREAELLSRYIAAELETIRQQMLALAWIRAHAHGR